MMPVRSFSNAACERISTSVMCLSCSFWSGGRAGTAERLVALLAASAATSGLPVTIDNREQHFHFHAARLVQADFDGERKSRRFWDSGILFIAIVKHCSCFQ
jgi:hypothetical protein